MTTYALRASPVTALPLPMHLQPNRNYSSNDDVQTPLPLARRLVAHFKPRGRILEPCAGDGNFLRALRAHVPSATGNFKPSTFNCRRARRGDSRVDWCELKRGRDFLVWQERVDWVITNPPWSQFRDFLRHALAVADDVVFLVTINHLWTQARMRDITAADFGVREIVMVAMPATFPPLGFQLGAIHLSRGWTGPLALTDWRPAPQGEPAFSTPSPIPPRPPRSAQPKRATAPSRPPVSATDAAPHRRPRNRGRGSKISALPSAWMSGRELGALSTQEHLRLLLRAA